MGLNVISLLVENKPGVLFNISNTIRRKNFNIHSITAIAGEEGDTSRITLTSMGDAKEVDKLVENASVLIDVVIKAKPAASKGVYLKKISISLSMISAFRTQKEIYRHELD